MKAIVLIVIDCLRADHCSAYGYWRDTTPTLAHMAGEGVLWERAYATSSWTKPSVTSLLTGMYPSEHGAFEGVKRSKGRMTTDAISSDCVTLAERLTDAGWRCGAFVNNAQLDEFSGLNRGFDRYDARAGKSDRILELFRHWLGDAAGRPSFAYLHFLEAHWPYKPRRRHLEMFGGDRDASAFYQYSARDFGRLRKQVALGEVSLSRDQIEDIVRLYDAAVRRMDGKIKVVQRILENAGIADGAALFVTADHGEEFLEHGRIGHGHSLHTELTHVPLVAVVPRGPAGVRRTEPVSHADLASTILAVAGAGGARGANLLGERARPRPAVSELRLRRKGQRAIRSGALSLHQYWRAGDATEIDAVLTGDPMQEALYELSSDPLETTNLRGDSRLEAPLQNLRTQLLAWQSESAVPARRSEIEIDRELVQRLRAMGYVD